MLIAFNRVNAVELGLEDVRDFYSSVKGAHRGSDEELNIDEIMQVLNAWLVLFLLLYLKSNYFKPN